MNNQSNLPTKKQRELLNFIDTFIKGNGYGPSYREVMRSLEYKSVSTVATHVDSLITKGLLVKRDNSARSLEVVVRRDDPHYSWLMSEIDKKLASDISSEDKAALSRVKNLF